MDGSEQSKKDLQTIKKPTIELNVLFERQNVLENVPKGINLREWLAGLVIGNASIMKEVSPNMYVQFVIDLVDRLVVSLSSDRKEQNVQDAAENMQPTVREIKKQTRSQSNRTKTLTGVVHDDVEQDHESLTHSRISQKFLQNDMPPPKTRKDTGAGRYMVVLLEKDTERTSPLTRRSEDG